MNTKLHICYTCAEDLGLAYVCCLVYGSVSESPNGQENKQINKQTNNKSRKGVMHLKRPSCTLEETAYVVGKWERKDILGNIPTKSQPAISRQKFRLDHTIDILNPVKYTWWSLATSFLQSSASDQFYISVGKRNGSRAVMAQRIINRYSFKY